MEIKTTIEIKLPGGEVAILTRKQAEEIRSALTKELESGTPIRLGDYVYPISLKPCFPDVYHRATCVGG
jgi:hypothetical protein